MCCVSAPPAHAANEVQVTMTGGVLFDTCGDYGYSYSASLPAGFSAGWSLELQLIGPDGNEIDSDFLLDDPTVGVGSFFLCESPNLAGTYTVRTGETARACNSEYDCVPITSTTSYAQFRLPMTRTTVKANVIRPRKGQVVRFTITSRDERPEGYFGTPYAAVRLQAYRDGRWRSIKKTSTSDTGRATIEARYAGKKVKVRAVTDGDSSRTGSTSRTIRIG